MPPELKIACETVFQEHKTSIYPVLWNKDPFRGRISIGLSEMAKETLKRKNIILFPNPGKKIITVLNPAVVTATTFEEAEEMAKNKVPSLAASIANHHPTTYVASHVSDVANYPSRHIHRVITIAGKPEPEVAELKWYLKPLFCYVVWPACAAVFGAFFAYLMGTVYTELFFHLKK